MREIVMNTGIATHCAWARSGQARSRCRLRRRLWFEPACQRAERVSASIFPCGDEQARIVTRSRQSEISQRRCGAARISGQEFRCRRLVETLGASACPGGVVAGFARVLADDGILLISSPDKHAYSEVAGSATSSTSANSISMNCSISCARTSAGFACTGRSCCSSRCCDAGWIR